MVNFLKPLTPIGQNFDLLRDQSAAFTDVKIYIDPRKTLDNLEILCVFALITVSNFNEYCIILYK